MRPRPLTPGNELAVRIIMETIEMKLQNSRSNIVRETRAFVSSAKEASTTFAADAGKATGKLGGFAGKETRSWASYLTERGRELGTSSLQMVELGALERGLLSQVSRALDLLSEKVACRLARLGDGDVLPLQQYDTLSARAIVTQLDELSTAQCATVLAFEQANKKRATVVRALEHRIAA